MSAKDDYKLGSRVYSGDDVRAVARATRVEGLQNISRAQVAGDQYSRTSGLLRAVGPGWVVNRQHRLIRRGGNRRHNPWEISVSNNMIHVRPGSINGMLPTNMFDAFGPISGQGTVYVSLQVFTDGIQPTNCFLFISTDPPHPPPWNQNLAPYQFQVSIGLTVNVAPFNVVDGLLWATPEVVLQTLSQSIAPGRPYYDNNYSWTVTQY